MKLPRNINAVIPQSKIIDYLLSETHSVGKAKAKYFKMLGYNQDNCEELKDALILVAHDNEVTEIIDTPYGNKYIIDGNLVTPSGKRARVRTIWIMEAGKELPCFVTAYPIGE
jgi:hypothetical protein